MSNELFGWLRKRKYKYKNRQIAAIAISKTIKHYVAFRFFFGLILSDRHTIKNTPVSIHASSGSLNFLTSESQPENTDSYSPNKWGEDLEWKNCKPRMRLLGSWWDSEIRLPVRT